MAGQLSATTHSVYHCSWRPASWCYVPGLQLPLASVLIWLWLMKGTGADCSSCNSGVNDSSMRVVLVCDSNMGRAAAAAPSGMLPQLHELLLACCRIPLDSLMQLLAPTRPAQPDIESYRRRCSCLVRHEGKHA